MRFDYSQFENRDKRLRAELDAIDQTELTADDALKVERIMGAIQANDEAAGELRDQEVSYLREKFDALQTGTAPAADADAALRADWTQFMVRGETKFTNTALKIGTDANGGFVVPEPIHAPLVEAVRKYNPVMADAALFIMNGDTTINLPIKATHGVVAPVAETASRTEQTEPTFSGNTLVAYDYYTDQRATQTFLDSVSGSDAMLMSWIYEDLLEQVELDCVTGSGAAKAQGLFTTGSGFFANSCTSSSGSLVNSQFLNAYFALHPKYRARGAWYMSSATAATVAAMTHPSASGYMPLVDWNGGNPTVLGKPIRETYSAPAAAAGVTPVVLGDLKAAYAVGIHARQSILRDPYSAPPNIRFYALMRAGGGCWDKAAAINLTCMSS